MTDSGADGAARDDDDDDDFDGGCDGVWAVEADGDDDAGSRLPWLVVTLSEVLPKDSK